jgi:ubiquinone/menaquinone biosynthesis C-methylase UbiE
MREEPIRLYLKKLEEYRLKNMGLSRPDMADELGIPVGTYGNWYRKSGKHAKPSPKYVEWIKRFLKERGIMSADQWIKKDGPDLLERIGFKKGQAIMDFGSGNGDYSIILAEIAGEKGKVFAVDKNKNVLGGLMGRGYGRRLENIEDIFVSEGVGTPTKIPLPDGSIDAIWFSDVLHDGYFEKDEEKEELLQNCYMALKKKGFIAVHPVHMEEKRLKEVIKCTNFYLEKEYRAIILFHGEEFHKGSIFKYKKKA